MEHWNQVCRDTNTENFAELNRTLAKRHKDIVKLNYSCSFYLYIMFLLFYYFKIPSLIRCSMHKTKNKKSLKNKFI